MGSEDRATFGPAARQQRDALAAEWRRLGRVATAVAVLTSPVTFAFFHVTHHWSILWSAVATFAFIVSFRGIVDVVVHRFIPRASLYGAGREIREQDVTDRRRVWYWRARIKNIIWLAVIAAACYGLYRGLLAVTGYNSSDLRQQFTQSAPSLILLLLQLPLLFLINFGIIFGPLLFFGLKQMKGYEPGDADWGVKLGDVRGQSEPKQEVTKIIELWSAGEQFRRAGGKPERGLLFIGAPGTGKTMLSKAIATSFNSPIVTMPGSGFAQTFIGMDVIIVMFLIRKARRLARKWGGTCMIFIDEIDAVGLRRQALGAGTGMTGFQPVNDGFDEPPMYGPWGSLTSSGDLVLETRQWRDRLFAQRAPEPGAVYPAFVNAIRDRIVNIIPGGMMGMGMGGGLALNQLLVQMDGVDEPPAMRKWVTKFFNTTLDATYLVPQRIGKVRLRVRPPRPRSEQVYFIGATNVPIEALDPALVRPGRLGRHIWFRTPTKDDREDIFDLYLGRVAHDPELDRPERRDELARMTNGYSPAMIEQVCSMALTYAHSDGRAQFERADIVEAMTTIESGTAVSVEYVEQESRAVAIHEAGHAVASHVYMHDMLSTRLSIRMRGGSLGHHQAIEKEERFSSWRHEEVGKLVWFLGAMAAEHVFYGENGVGVGGDVQGATWRVARMVGMAGMGPEPIDLRGRVPAEQLRRKQRELMDRFERIGLQIMNRARGMSFDGDPIAAVLGDPAKRRMAAQILGQAYLTAVCCIRENRDAVAAVAEALVQRRELYGDEVVQLLEAANPQAPVIDLLDEEIWPRV
jgi:ATP-dependent Zn protease